MKSTILSTSLSLSAFAAHSDLRVIAPAWGHMDWRLADQAAVKLDKDKTLKVATGVLAGATSFPGGVKLVDSDFALTGVATVSAIKVNVGLNGGIIWPAGRAWAHVVLEADLEQCVESLVRTLLLALAGTLGARD